jgi:hypothetical protein
MKPCPQEIVSVKHIGVNMTNIMDDFEDDFEYSRLKHFEACGIEPYGDLYFQHMPDFEGLMKHAKTNPVYDLSTKPINESKAFFNGLGNLATYRGFNNKDNPEDLYQPNNQTVLDPSLMPDLPVDPDLFLSKVIVELQSNGVLVADAVEDVLSLMCRLFNFSILPNRPIPHGLSNLVFPAQTGIGKSVSLQVYVSMLEKHASILVVPKVEEAIKYCENINRLSGDPDYARCFYSITDKNSDSALRVDAINLSDYRCIVITHNMFLNLNKERKVERFSLFNGSKRSFVSIDEKLALYEKYSLGFRQLDNIIERLEYTLKQSKALSSISTSQEALDAIQKFKDYLISRAELLISDDNSVVIANDAGVGISLDKMLSGLGEQLNYSDQRNGFPKKLIGLKNKSIVTKALEKNYIRYQDKKRNVIGCSFTDHIKSFHGDLLNIDDFFCERIDPPVANCTSTAKDGNERSLEMMDYMNLGGTSLSMDYESPLGVAILVTKIIFAERIKEIFDELKALGSNSNPSYENRVLNRMNEWLDDLRYLVDTHVLLHKTNFETTFFTTENITNKLGLSVVLDATAQINEYYQLANRFLGHVGFVSAPQVRKYSNLTIYTASGFNQSRAAIYRSKQPDEIVNVAKSYASYAINELVDKADRMLIISHKDFSGALKKQISDSRIVFTHWGNHVGRNDWSDCNKVMLIGWNYLSPVEHMCAINSSLDSELLTSRHLDDDLLEKFEVSQLADDIVQGLMRSQARIIATDESDCKPTSFYLFYQDDDKSRKVLELVESQFPQSAVIDWKPSGTDLPKRKTKRNKKDDEVVDYLLQKAKDHETYLRKDIEKDLRINKSTMSRMLARDYFKEQLAKNGITFTNKDAKSQQFILK